MVCSDEGKLGIGLSVGAGKEGPAVWAVACDAALFKFGESESEAVVVDTERASEGGPSEWTAGVGESASDGF